MPALKIFPNLTTRPFASDDLQIACFIVGLCRILQVICVAPIWVHLYLFKFNQGQQPPYWCEENFADTVQSTGSAPVFEFEGVLNTTNSTANTTDLYNSTTTNSTFETEMLQNATNATTTNATSIISNVTDIFNSTTTNSTFETLPPTIIISSPIIATRYSDDGDEYARRAANGAMIMRFHLLLTIVWCLCDLGILAGIWSASNVGTPTQFMGRDKFIRPLIQTKIVFIYPVTALAVVIGILVVHYNRETNYGCKNTPYEPGKGFEATAYYTLFCIMLVSQSIEVFFWPSLLVGKLSTLIRRYNPLRLEHAGFQRSTSIDVCMTGIFKFCSLITCKRTDMKKSGELKDAAEAVLEFFRDGVGVTWSDLYIAIRVLAQVQRERKLKKIQIAQRFLNEHFNSIIAATSINRPTQSLRAMADAADMNIDSAVSCNSTTLLTGDFLERVDETSAEENPTDDGGFGEGDTSTAFFSVADIGQEQEALDPLEEIVFFDDDGESSSSTASDSSSRRQRRQRKVRVLEESIDTNTTTEDEENRCSTSSSIDKQQENQTPSHTGERSIQVDPAPTSRRRQHHGPLHNDKRHSVVLVRNDDVSGEFSKYEKVVRSVLSPENSEEVHIVRSALRYAKHSNAVYDDVLNLCKDYYNLGIDVFQIIPDGNVGKVLDSFMEHSIVLDTIGINKAVLAYSHFRNGMSQTPYYITVDEVHREVVLSIRGTASLEDAVIDLQLIPSDLTELGNRCGFNGNEQKCHRGVLTRCIWIYDDLKSHGVLRDLLLGENSRYPFFKFIVTGHSLGAGCAAMLSCMLRKEFPDLKCFAFEPPGGLMTTELAEYCNEFVTSFVNGADVIPRTSYVNFEKLRDEALETLARVRVSKFQVYRSLRRPHSDKYVAEMNSRLMYPPEETPKNTEYYAALEDFRQRKIDKLQEINVPLLFLPGKIVHIIQTKKGKRTEKGKEGIGSVYTPQWAERTDFNEILLSNRLVDDHSMTSVISNISSILELLANPNTLFAEEEGDDDDDDEALEDTEGIHKTEDKNPALVLDRDFICCSRPHGNRPFVGAVFASAACLMCMVSNSTCLLVERTTEVLPLGNSSSSEHSFYGVGVSTGLFNFEEKVYDGTGNITDPDNYVRTRTCQPFPLWFEVDSYLKKARIFGALAVVMSGMGMLVLWLSTCIRIPRCQWIFMSCLLACSLVFQTLVMVFYYESSACTEFEYREEDAAFIVSSECVDSVGASFAKASFYTIGVTFLLTVKYPKSNF